MMGKNDAGGLVIGFLIGSAVGSAVGTLYAIRTGIEVRREIKVKTLEAKQMADYIIEDARVNAERIMERAKSGAVQSRNGDKPVAAELEAVVK